MAEPGHLIGLSEAIHERGTGLRFDMEVEGEEVPAFAVRVNGKVQAYLNQCAHIPVELDWKEGEFFDISGSYLICATHGAWFRPDDGLCLGGPCAGKRLTKVAVEEHEGQVFWLNVIQDRNER